ncbi:MULTISPECIES: hypothetical protein [Serratia]|uniref:hypothetical protein n=1 Tax=Serratia TaxID=613 RepID=UPI000660F9EA|nr:hypothetical protein [Serratia sp. 506_PEND]
MIIYDKEYYEDYYNTQYSTGYLQGKGVEEIFRLLLNKKPDYWIDLGSGGISLYWSMPIKSCKKILITDFNMNSLKLFLGYIIEQDIPRGYKEAAIANGITDYQQRVANHKASLSGVRIIDAFQPWSNDSKVDLITAFGVFSLCGSYEKFRDCFNYALSNLQQNGDLIGANWLFTEEYAQNIGIVNSFVTCENILKIAEDNNAEVVDLIEVELNEKNYSKVIIYSLRRK